MPLVKACLHDVERLERVVSKGLKRFFTRYPSSNFVLLLSFHPYSLHVFFVRPAGVPKEPAGHHRPCEIPSNRFRTDRFHLIVFFAGK